MLYVWDDGIGMTEEKKEQLMREVISDETEEQQNQSNRPIGLRNVYSRLELCYPKKVSLVIQTVENEYTMIGFQIKMK